MEKYFIGLIFICGLFLVPQMVGAALAPQLVINDSQKICVEGSSQSYQILKSGWRSQSNQNIYNNPLDKKCPVGYRLLPAGSVAVDELAPEYFGKQLGINIISWIIFLLQIPMALKLFKPFPVRGSKGYLKLLGIIVGILIITFILRMVMMVVIYPCNYLETC